MHSIAAGANDGGTGAGNDFDPYAEAGAMRKGAKYLGSDEDDVEDNTPSF